MTDDRQTDSTMTGASLPFEISPDEPEPLSDDEKPQEPEKPRKPHWTDSMNPDINFTVGDHAVKILILGLVINIIFAGAILQLTGLQSFMIRLVVACAVVFVFFVLGLHIKELHSHEEYLRYYNNVRLRDYDKQLHDIQAAKTARNVGAAHELALKSFSLLDSSEKIVKRLPFHLAQSSTFIKRAEQEYRENAFAPYWDAVEQATRHLGSFNGDVQLLSQNTQEYYTKINNRKHTFPSMRRLSVSLPDATPVLNELRRVVRLGQTNYQFAAIWEQRKIREVLIAGFRTLGDAVENLGSTIEQSVSELGASVTSSIGKVVEEQISTREAIKKQTRQHGEMLDNIQRHREPTLPTFLE